MKSGGRRIEEERRRQSLVFSLFDEAQPLFTDLHRVFSGRYNEVMIKGPENYSASDRKDISERILSDYDAFMERLMIFVRSTSLRVEAVGGLDTWADHKLRLEHSLSITRQALVGLRRLSDSPEWVDGVRVVPPLILSEKEPMDGIDSAYTALLVFVKSVTVDLDAMGSKKGRKKAKTKKGGEDARKTSE